MREYKRQQLLEERRAAVDSTFSKSSDEPFKILQLKEALKLGENVSDYFGVFMARFRNVSAITPEQPNDPAWITLHDMAFDLIDYTTDDLAERGRLYNKFTGRKSDEYFVKGQSYTLTSEIDKMKNGWDVPNPFAHIATRYRRLVSFPEEERPNESPIVQTVTAVSADLLTYQTEIPTKTNVSDSDKATIDTFLPNIHIPDEEKLELITLEKSLTVANNHRTREPLYLKLPTETVAGPYYFRPLNGTDAEFVQAFFLAEPVTPEEDPNLRDIIASSNGETWKRKIREKNNKKD